MIGVDGRLIGINSAILGYPGIGFAIPTSIAVDVMQQLITTGTVERGWIEIEARDLSTMLRSELKAKSDFGIVVLAAIITHIAGQAIRDSQQAIETISGLRPGTSVSTVACRRGEKSTFDTMVAKRRHTSNE